MYFKGETDCGCLTFYFGPLCFPDNEKDRPSWWQCEDRTEHYDEKICELIKNVVVEIRKQYFKFFEANFEYEQPGFYWSRFDYEEEVIQGGPCGEYTIYKTSLIKRPWFYLTATPWGEVRFSSKITKDIEANLPLDAYLTSQYPYIRNLAKKELEFIHKSV